MAKLSDRCFCWFPVAMLVPLGRAPTCRLHTKLYKFRWNCLRNNAVMKNRTDLNLGDAFCLSIIYHIPDSWLNLLNGYDFYFRCKPPICRTSILPTSILPFFTAGSSIVGRKTTMSDKSSWDTLRKRRFSIHKHLAVFYLHLALNLWYPRPPNRPLSRGGHFESQGNKKLCFCPPSLALDERLDGQNLLFQHCVIKFYSMLCRRCGLRSRRSRKKYNIVLRERVGNVHDLGQDGARTTAHYHISHELLYTSRDVVFLPYLTPHLGGQWYSN